MYLLYNTLFLFFFGFALLLSLLKWYKKGWGQRWGFLPQRLKENLKGKRPIWLHAVSVGEVISLIPLLRRIKEHYPFQEIVLSTTTFTGNYTATLKVREALAIIFFPLDFPWVVKRIVKGINPKAFLVAESEIWPNLLKRLKKQGIPIVIVNGRISTPSYRKYKWIRPFFKKVLENITLFCMQSDLYSDRIIKLGAPPSKVITTGNFKFDQEICKFDTREIRYSLGLGEDKRPFVAGSTHKGEEEIILDVFIELKRNYPDLVLILVPRHPERFSEVEELLQRYPIKYLRKTRIDSGLNLNSIGVILVDTIGELQKLYSIGEVIFVGGSLVKVGGHNVLEAAIYKRPVLFGPFMDNFSEIAMVLKESGGGIEVKDREEFILKAKTLLGNPSLLEELGEAAYKVVIQNQGAVEKTFQLITPFIQ